jgi:hypothetical protein
MVSEDPGLKNKPDTLSEKINPAPFLGLKIRRGGSLDSIRLQSILVAASLGK